MISTRTAFAVLALTLIAPSAEAARLNVLYSFCQSSGCPDGQYPGSPLVQDAHGNLYGTTAAGGNANNAGALFELQKVRRNWVFHSLYSFCAQSNCADGSVPVGGVIVDTSGNLYGTTNGGGNANKGVVYELDKHGTLKVMYSFCAQSQCTDGDSPQSGLTYQGQQNGQLYDGTSTLYGITELGGTKNWGVVFAITPGTSESVLYAFGENDNANDGQDPEAPPIMDSAGNVFGTTLGGGLGCGTLFGISPAGAETLLFAFGSQGGNYRGCIPVGGLLMQPDGTFVGTTLQGGPRYQGNIYSFAAGTYTSLAVFCRRRNCNSGGYPYGALVRDASGNLFGTAFAGGTDEKGTVFKVAGSRLKAVYSFCAQSNCTDGEQPTSTLLMNGSGALFGVTGAGGAYNSGEVFELY